MKKQAGNQGGSLQSGLVPDYTCIGCGKGHFGEREPLHCPRCGGTRFDKIDEIKTADEFDWIVGTVKRIMRDATAARWAVHKSRHRRRAKIVNALGRLERHAETILRRMTEIPNPLAMDLEARPGPKNRKPKQAIETEIKPASNPV